MKTYIHNLREEIWVLDREIAEIHDRVYDLSPGYERDALTREWALGRGKILGIKWALAELQDYLRKCIEEIA